MEYFFEYETPIGYITLVENNGYITHLRFGRHKHSEKKETELIATAYAQLCEYFSGKRKEFDLPLQPEGTQFQQSVWKQLQKIPYGELKSYKDIAHAINSPKAYRAVGMANNKNPIAIMIPCHRVVGADGSMVGYAAGLEAKKTLLELEFSRKFIL